MNPIEVDDAQILAQRAQIESPLDPQRYTTLRRLVAQPEHRFVVSLGGGASPALGGNIALTRILEELGLRPHVAQIWGTSAGAVAGAGWASGAPGDQALELACRAHRLWRVRWSRLALGLLLRAFGKQLPEGLIDSSRFAPLLDEGLPVKEFERCEIPFRCVAGSIHGDIRSVVFSEGALIPAILSSMCILGVFSPPGRESNGYCDGGLVERTPLRSPIGEHLRTGDKRKLLLLATHFGAGGRGREARGFVERFFYGVDMMEELLWPYQLEEARRYPNVQVIVLDPQMVEPHPTDFARVLLHYLRARQFFVHRLENAQISLALGGV